MPNTTLRVMSWNLRTFGSAVKSVTDIWRIAAIILDVKADVVCVQEIMTGQMFGAEMGQPINVAPEREFARLVTKLIVMDGGAQWNGVLTGNNAFEHADAYGFLWKGNPSASLADYNHPNSPPTITQNTPPRILFATDDTFPGRRPGALGLTVASTKGDVRINFLSYHAMTPTNKYLFWQEPGEEQEWDDEPPGKPGAGFAVSELGSLLAADPNFMPPNNTLLCGDFNFDLTKTADLSRRKRGNKWVLQTITAATVYQNLTKKFTLAMFDANTLADIKTTYIAVPDQQRLRNPNLRFVSSYDHIFSCGPGLELAEAGNRYDFIAFLKNFQRQSTSWEDMYNELYSYQHGRIGLSDHTPVYAEYWL